MWDLDFMYNNYYNIISIDLSNIGDYKILVILSQTGLYKNISTIYIWLQAGSGHYLTVS